MVLITGGVSCYDYNSIIMVKQAAIGIFAFFFERISSRQAFLFINQFNVSEEVIINV